MASPDHKASQDAKQASHNGMPLSPKGGGRKHPKKSSSRKSSRKY